MSRRMRSPMRVWSRTCTHSASVSGPLRLRISSGIAILPTSCSTAANSRSRSAAPRRPRRRPTATARWEVSVAWSCVSASLASSALASAVTVDEVRALEVVVQARAAQHAGRVGREGLQRAEHAGLGRGVVDDHQQQRVGAVVAAIGTAVSIRPCSGAHSSAGPGRPRRPRKPAGSSTRIGRPRSEQARVDDAVERRERHLVQAAADRLARQRVADGAGRGGDEARAGGPAGDQRRRTSRRRRPRRRRPWRRARGRGVGAAAMRRHGVGQQPLARDGAGVGAAGACVASTRASSRGGVAQQQGVLLGQRRLPAHAQRDDRAVHLLAAGDRRGHERVDALALQVRVAQARLDVAGHPERARREHGELEQRVGGDRHLGGRRVARLDAAGVAVHEVASRDADAPRPRRPSAPSSSPIASATTGAVRARSGGASTSEPMRSSSSSCSSNLTLLVSGLHRDVP